MSELRASVLVSRRDGKWGLDIDGLPRWLIVELQEAINDPGIGLWCDRGGWWGDGATEHTSMGMHLTERDHDKDRSEVCARVSGRMAQYARFESGNADHGLTTFDIAKDIRDLLHLAYRPVDTQKGGQE